MGIDLASRHTPGAIQNAVEAKQSVVLPTLTLVEASRRDAHSFLAARAVFPVVLVAAPFYLAHAVFPVFLVAALFYFAHAAFQVAPIAVLFYFVHAPFESGVVSASFLLLRLEVGISRFGPKASVCGNAPNLLWAIKANLACLRIDVCHPAYYPLLQHAPQECLSKLYLCPSR